MIRLSAVPFYTVGAWTGLMQGYCYAALQVVKYIYGLSWLQRSLERVLPETVVAQEHGITPQQYAYTELYSTLPPVRYDAYVPTEDRIQLLERDYAAYKLEEGLEGELDLTITHSGGNALPESVARALTPLQAAADANGGALPDQSPSKAAKQYKAVSTSPADTRPLSPEIKTLAGAAAAAVTADEQQSEAGGPKGGDWSQGGEAGQQLKGLALLSGLPAGRSNRFSTTSAGSFGGNSATEDDTHSVSSIHTTDSIGTIERKKNRGLFSSLKAKALKGRQQVR